MQGKKKRQRRRGKKKELKILKEIDFLLFVMGSGPVRQSEYILNTEYICSPIHDQPHMSLNQPPFALSLSLSHIPSPFLPLLLLFPRSSHRSSISYSHFIAIPRSPHLFLSTYSRLLAARKPAQPGALIQSAVFECAHNIQQAYAKGYECGNRRKTVWCAELGVRPIFAAYA